MQDKNIFDIYYKKALNEAKNFDHIFLNEILDFARSFQSGFQKGLEGKFFEGDKKTNQISIKNKPKKGQIIVAPNSGAMVKSVGVIAKVVSDIDNEGQWEIEIINRDPDPSKFVSYFETTKPEYTDGVITTRDFLLRTHYDQGQQQPQPTPTPQPTPQPTPSQPPLEPPDGTTVTSKKSGKQYKYDANKKIWIDINTKKALNKNASDTITTNWQKKQQQQTTPQPTPTPQQQNQKQFVITYGSGPEYPQLRCTVGYNTVYPTWYDEKEYMKGIKNN
jgi:hypothetical protein